MRRRFQHSLGSVREVVKPLLTGSLPYVLALGAVGGLGWFIWKSVGPASPEPRLVAGEESMTGGWERALALAESGDLEKAREAMRALAPLSEDGGDLRAHWWLAEDLLKHEEVGEWTGKARLERARGHLQRVHAGGGNARAGAVLGQVHLLLGEVQEAFPLLEEAAEEDPALALMASELAGRLGDEEKQRALALRAATHFQGVCEDESHDPKERRAAREAWAKAEIGLDRFEAARAVLAPLEDRSDATTALLEESWIGTIMEGRDQGGAWVAAQLERAWEAVGPRVRLIELAGALGSGVTDREVFGRLYDRMVRDLPEERGAMAGALGALALALGKTKAGLAHLEEAATVEPENLVVLNNLGYGLAQMAQPPQRERALELLDRAVAVGEKRGMLPADCLETRGQILAALERWEEAAVDLERALPGVSNRIPIHQTLAHVYRRLGQETLAREHGRLAQGVPGNVE